MRPPGSSGFVSNAVIACVCAVSMCIVAQSGRMTHTIGMLSMIWTNRWVCPAFWYHQRCRGCTCVCSQSVYRCANEANDTHHWDAKHDLDKSMGLHSVLVSSAIERKVDGVFRSGGLTIVSAVDLAIFFYFDSHCNARKVRAFDRISMYCPGSHRVRLNGSRRASWPEWLRPIADGEKTRVYHHRRWSCAWVSMSY